MIKKKGWAGSRRLLTGRLLGATVAGTKTSVAAWFRATRGCNYVQEKAQVFW
jgi:hypothetical protein